MAVVLWPDAAAKITRPLCAKRCSVLAFQEFNDYLRISSQPDLYDPKQLPKILVRNAVLAPPQRVSPHRLPRRRVEPSLPQVDDP